MQLETNNIQICNFTRKELRYSLMWPPKEYELTSGNWNYIRIAFFFLILAPWFCTLIMHITMAFRNDLNMSEDVALMCCFCGLSYMILAFVKNQPKIALLLRDLSNFKKFGLPPGFETLDKKLNFGAVCAWLYSVFAIITYSLAKVIYRSECEEISVAKGVKEICGLPTAVWIPIDVNYFPIYHLLYIYVFICMQMILKSALIISYMLLEIVHYLVLRIKHLEQMISDCFKNEQEYEASKKKFKNCIVYHKEILEFARRINDCFSADMFAHLAMTAVICGCLDKQFIDGQCRPCAFLHNFGWCLALCVACYSGQHLINASASLSDAIWSSTWYQADINRKKDLMFMLMRSRKINCVTAGPFSEVSYPLFLWVMKMSYSILCFLTS